MADLAGPEREAVEERWFAGALLLHNLTFLQLDWASPCHQYFYI